MTSLAAERPITAEEFLAIPDDDCEWMELWDGEITYMSLPGDEHGRVAESVTDGLKAFVLKHHLGIIRRSTGFLLNDFRVVGPDVAFVAKEALDPDRDRTKAFGRAPTLAIEVVSPNDGAVRLGEKILGYLDAGTLRVWTVEPRHRTVTVHRPGGESHTYIRNGTLTSDDAGFAVPGFELTLEQIFASDE